MNRIVCLIVGISWMTGTAMAQQPEDGPPPPPAGGSFQPGGPPGGGLQPHGPMGQPKGDPITDNFFAPESLMHNQKKLGLTDDQQKYIREQIRDTQGKVTDLQWQLQGEQEKLMSLARQEKADEKECVAALDKLLGFENDIKRCHLTLLIRIKNKLTPEQQQQLREMRRPNPPRGPMSGGPGGVGGPGGTPATGR